MFVFVASAINYDEKDPFLCNACGYCKYAKFDFTVTSRPCCAVDPIENDDDRKKVRLQFEHFISVGFQAGCRKRQLNMRYNLSQFILCCSYFCV